jgi:RNA polymerase sigma-70 factor (ECF subfamily)
VRRRARTPRLSGVEPTVEYGPDVARALRRAIASLPEAQRAVVVLKLIEGWRFREIAARLGVSEAACKMRLARALEQLRDALDEEGVRP